MDQATIKRWWSRGVDRLEELWGRSDFLLLVAALVLAAAGGLIAEVAEAVMEGESHWVDQKLLMIWREAGQPSDPIGGPQIEEGVRDLTSLGGVLITSLVTLLTAGYFVLDGRPRAALFLLAAVTLGAGLTHLLKVGVARPRPDLALSPPGASATSSFPSGHAANATVVYMTAGALLARGLRRTRLKVYVVGLAAVLAAAVGISRIYMGVHWPTDVFAGWTLGASWGLVAWILERVMRQRGWLEPAPRLLPVERLEEVDDP